MTLLIIAGVILLALFLFGCRLKCGSKKENYTRTCLAGDCFGLQRTPVDYAQKYPNGWQRNPHYKANPADEHQPLEFGPIDFYPDTRRMNANNGVLFQQYRDDWKGCGKGGVYLTNDEKTRFDLTNLGDVGARAQLEDMYNPRFGPRGYQHNERSYDEPNPYFDKIYGGAKWLHNSKIGN